MPKIFLAESFALLRDGIYETETPDPIAPTNMMYTAVKTSDLPLLEMSGVLSMIKAAK